MKLTKLLFATLTFTFLSFGLQAENIGDDRTLREEIQTILQKNADQMNFDDKLVINFLVNTQNEIIIVSTGNSEHDATVRNILNMKKIKAVDVEYNKIYTLPVEVKKM